MIAWVENVTSLDEIGKFLQTNVFIDYRANVVETKEGRILRSK